MTNHYIIFSVAGTSYALPSHQVGHIEMVDQITRVPNAPPFVDGVVFSRGEVVPALSLRARFGFDRVANDTRTRLLVVQSGERVIGLIVDAAREFLTLPESAIRPPNEGLAGPSGRYLRGIAVLGDRMIVLLDLDALLTPDDQAISASGELAIPHAQEIQ